MRVIAGTAKGRVLFAPKGIGTRPILSMIKESLFNIWQEQVKSARFLDLFAGSGSIGIEALSRGAKEVVFVEKNRSAVSIIRKNLALCQFQTGWSVYLHTALAGGSWCGTERQRGGGSGSVLM